jgi:serine protease AprX
VRTRISLRLILASLAILAATSPAFAQPNPLGKLDALARTEQSRSAGWSRVIVLASDQQSVPMLRGLVERMGGLAGRELPIINGHAALVPNAALAGLARSPFVAAVAFDRRVSATLERTAATVGAVSVRQEFGYDGAGIGVAVIDSGVTSWHDDLTGPAGQRVSEFVDFVSGSPSAYDDYGHGTHVAGTIAGNGFDSGGARTGIAPGVHLLVLKALDGTGVGQISDVIAAMDYVLTRKNALNIRVANLSFSAGVFDGYDADPLTLATRRLVEAGIVVVASAGNNGRDVNGQPLYGGVSAPANAPWVLTVGASNHGGTASRSDDSAAPFSARGPANIVNNAKPDILAPGVGIESLADPASALYSVKSAYLLGGSVATAYLPYLSLSGTSMAAPVVSGAVALMLQANPALTPNAVKAILQYTAQASPAYDALTQGAGFLNARGAVELARYFAAPADTAYPSMVNWSGSLIWGNQLVRRGRLLPNVNAWRADVLWGGVRTPSGENVKWGVGIASDDAKDDWGTKCLDAACKTVQWGFGKSQNVVWGISCGNADCTTAWNPSANTSLTDPTAATLVWGSTVVWGSADDGDTVVWGSADEGDTVVWGSGCRGEWCDVLWNPDVR